MRLFIIDSNGLEFELQGGLIGVVGSQQPGAGEKGEVVEAIAEYVLDGWAIAADPFSPIGRLAALVAETACVPFVSLQSVVKRFEANE